MKPTLAAESVLENAQLLLGHRAHHLNALELHVKTSSMRNTSNGKVQIGM